MTYDPTPKRLQLDADEFERMLLAALADDQGDDLAEHESNVDD